MKNIKKFLELNGADIVSACVGTGLFPSVLMGQLIQESSGQYGDYGLSYLAYKYNNYGGIKKWSGYSGSSVKMKTGEDTKNGVPYVIQADFCVFSDFKDFLKWRTIFLKRNRGYDKAGVFNAKMPYEQIVALKKAGYATDVQYVSRVYSQITTYNLTKLDDELKKKLIPKLEAPLLTASSSGWFKTLLQTFSLTIDTTKVK
ncbi:glucosaminidase domain-containing protein [Pedobacter jeongneungensis]|uniref:glucosaminidase domain-containing protein n=1 Tax=Pedobacter jeongneungensis TaxID=947309 RepID=UPI000469CB62|nr:glucosaminidase domain-containing protein [Pedobacter jeongneungensis]